MNNIFKKPDEETIKLLKEFCEKANEAIQERIDKGSLYYLVKKKGSIYFTKASAVFDKAPVDALIALKKHPVFRFVTLSFQNSLADIRVASTIPELKEPLKTLYATMREAYKRHKSLESVALYESVKRTIKSTMGQHV